MTAAGRLGSAVRSVAADLTPLREFPAFRRLFAGQVVSMVGTQVTAVAVPLQVFAITRSSLDVGLAGLVGLVPLIVFGLYGGAIADSVDRRRLVLLTSTLTMLVSGVLLAQAVLQLDRVSLLYGCVAVQAGCVAVDSPTRRAIIPQLVRPEKLPAANTLRYGGGQLAIIAGPLLAGLAVGAGGYAWAYAIDVASFAAMFYATVRLPALPPGDGARRAGLASVVEGLRFLGGRSVLWMSFLLDINAMLFASPRALFPALAEDRYGGGAGTASLLYAAVAAGAVLATVFGGAIARVHRQALGVIVSIAIWGVAITLLGLVSWLWLGLALLAVAGAADTVSAVYRSTILQVTTPSGMQGRLQGVYIVVVSGGPRLGDLRSGAVASVSTPAVSLVTGGIACLVGLVALACAAPAFARYDARQASAARLAESGAEVTARPNTSGG